MGSVNISRVLHFRSCSRVDILKSNNCIYLKSTSHGSQNCALFIFSRFTRERPSFISESNSSHFVRFIPFGLTPILWAQTNPTKNWIHFWQKGKYWWNSTNVCVCVCVFTTQQWIWWRWYTVTHVNQCQRHSKHFIIRRRVVEHWTKTWRY